MDICIGSYFGDLTFDLYKMTLALIYSFNKSTVSPGKSHLTRTAVHQHKLERGCWLAAVHQLGHERGCWPTAVHQLGHEQGC